jgi:hypothetical protein
MGPWGRVGPNLSPSSPPVGERRRKGRRARRKMADVSMPPVAFDSAAVRAAAALGRLGMR